MTGSTEGCEGAGAELFGPVAGTLERLPAPDSQLWLARRFLAPAESAASFARLRDEVAWRQDEIQVYGKSHAVPRLQAWIGDTGCRYSYSGIELEPLPFAGELRALRERLRAALGQDFNCVLANLYRDGSDSVGWHADDEPELGAHPVVASLSLGASRRLRLRHVARPELAPLSLELRAGDLFVMRGETQQHWQHQLPKSARRVGERINLSFRRIGL